MAGLSNPVMVIGSNAMKSFMTHAQLHWTAAGAAGTANVTIAGRQPILWGLSAADGDFDLASPIVFTGGAPRGAVYSVTLWSASAAGTFCGEFILSGDQTFNALGQYTVTAISLDGSATWAGAPGAATGVSGVGIVIPNPNSPVYPALRTLRRALH